MLKMMRACLGENVTPEYAPLMREEMGFIARDVRWAKQPASEQLQQQHVLIVGAGFGHALGVALGRLGIPYTIVEKNDDSAALVRQPVSLGVDTPNHSYSFSFGARNNWTRYFAQRDELLDYLKRSRSNMVCSHIRFNTRLTSSRWNRPAPLDLDIGKPTRAWKNSSRGPGQRDRPAQRSIAGSFHGERILPA